MYSGAWLSIFDLQKDKTLIVVELKEYISSVAFTKDNQSAFIGFLKGTIQLIKWKADANSEDDFDFSEEPIKVLHSPLHVLWTICLTKDEKNLLCGKTQLLSILNIEKRKVIKEFKLTGKVEAITLIKDGKTALIADSWGNFSILDRTGISSKEKFTVDKDKELGAKGMFLKRIIVI